MKRVCVLLFVASALGRAQPVVGDGGVLNAASYVLTGLPNHGIAQGSYFVIFGSGLGSTATATVPLPSTAGLAGTSVKVTSGGTTVNAYMVYTTPSLLAAILPSNTPVGAGTLTVTTNGQTSATAPIKVVKSAFGIFAQNAAGTGPAVAFNVNSDGSAALNTFTASAKPGQVMFLYGTGLGPVSPDNEGAEPKPGALDIATDVVVGGKSAQVLYKGRSSYIGVDQINFVVPDGVEGCHVPIVVVSDGITGNFGTIAVSATGSGCTDPAGINADDLGVVTSTGSLRSGVISLDRIGIKVSLLGLSVDAKLDNGNATFGQYTAAQFFGSQTSRATSIGSCFALGFKGDTPSLAFDPVKPTPLDAGPVINVNGPKGAGRLTKQADGSYSGSLSNPGLTTFLDPGPYTVDNGNGVTSANGVGAFRASITIPQPLTWTNQDAISTIDRSRPLDVTWSGGDPTGLVQILGYASAGKVGAAFICTERVSAGTFRVPAAVLQSIPAVASTGITPTALLSVGSQVTPVRFNAPGLDSGTLASAVLTGKAVTFQ